MTVACTIDVEEYGGAESRIEAVMDALLAHFADRNIRFTAFVVGDVARSHPDLVRRISAEGHEIALHGADHRVLSKWEPSEFVARCKDAREHLGDLAGSEVTGFRAPLFSLTPGVPWADGALADCGFAYSSSVVPSGRSYGDSGFPGAPREPFRWRSGLVELPAGLYARLPIGGSYLRLLPRAAVRRMRSGLPNRAAWIYCHPYDFDADEPYRRLPDTGRLVSRLLFARRRIMGDRLDDLLQGEAAAPLGEQVPELSTDRLPTFVPAARPGSDQASSRT